MVAETDLSGRFLCLLFCLFISQLGVPGKGSALFAYRVGQHLVADNGNPASILKKIYIIHTTI